MMHHIEEQFNIITSGAAAVFEPEGLKEKLAQNRPLTIKLGLDPTAPDLHLGHAVVLRKIRQMQELGHRAIIILGDFTGMIGDPTGRSKTRRQLTREEVKTNAATYRDQLSHILDMSKTEVRMNSEWLARLNFTDVLDLAAKTTVARLLERDDFKSRFENHQPIGAHELFYPLMQAFDSVFLRADIEMGGTDQTFNILAGREMQRTYGQNAQIALLMPILPGIDGLEKMSKSLGNQIGIHDTSDEMFGRIMSIPDSCIMDYFTLCTDLHPEILAEKRRRLETGENPRILKAELGREIVTLYHDKCAANEASERFDARYKKKELVAEQTLTISLAMDWTSIIMASGAVKSNSEARRLISGGGVRRNGVQISLNDEKPITGDVIQFGKRHFFSIVVTQ